MFFSIEFFLRFSSRWPAQTTTTLNLRNVSTVWRISMKRRHNSCLLHFWFSSFLFNFLCANWNRALIRINDFKINQIHQPNWTSFNIEFVIYLKKKTACGRLNTYIRDSLLLWFGSALLRSSIFYDSKRHLSVFSSWMNFLFDDLEFRNNFAIFVPPDWIALQQCID